MAFNWEAGAHGMLSNWSKDRRVAMTEQREFERQQKMADTNMLRQKELKGWEIKEGQKMEQEQYDLKKQRIIDSGIPEDDPRFQKAMTGIGESQDVLDTRELEMAEKKGKLGIKQGLALAEGQAKIKDKYKDPKDNRTAAERNVEAATKIMEGAKKDESGNPQYSMAEKMKLGLLGVEFKSAPIDDLKGADRVKLVKMAGEKVVEDLDGWEPQDYVNAMNDLQIEFGQDPKKAEKMYKEEMYKKNYTTAYNMVTKRKVAEVPKPPPFLMKMAASHEKKKTTTEKSSVSRGTKPVSGAPKGTASTFANPMGVASNPGGSNTLGGMLTGMRAKQAEMDANQPDHIKKAYGR